MRKFLGAIGFVWLIVLVGGCGLPDRSVGPLTNVTLKLQVGLSSPGLAELVDTVTLKIQYGDLEPEIRGLTMDENHEIHAELSIEPGDLISLTLTAYEITDSNWKKLYEGKSFIPALGNGERREINIYLSPQVLMLRPSPVHQVGALGDQDVVEISVWVHKVDSLYGASFRMHWDPAILNLLDAQQGGFLAGQTGLTPTIFFVDADSSTGTVACSVTRRRGQDILPPERSGSGTLARFFFIRIGAGESPITFATEPKLEPSLKRRSGANVDGYNELYLESATVVVTGGTG